MTESWMTESARNWRTNCTGARILLESRCPFAFGQDRTPANFPRGGSEVTVPVASKIVATDSIIISACQPVANPYQMTAENLDGDRGVKMTGTERGRPRQGDLRNPGLRRALIHIGPPTSQSSCTVMRAGLHISSTSRSIAPLRSQSDDGQRVSKHLLP